MGKEIYDEFLDYIKEIADVERSTGLLEWDQETYMPPGSTENRSYMIATLTGIQHRMTTAKKLGDYLEKLQSESTYAELDEFQQAIVREVARKYEKATKLPEDLVKELAKTKSQGFEAWVEARKKDKFEVFEPYLKKLVELTKEVAEAYGYEDHPYDALLDDYEPYMKVKELNPILENLERNLVPLVKKVLDSGFRPKVDILHRKYDIKKQEEFGRMVITDIGFDWNIGRLDVSAHPFTMGMGRDVRITTRYDEEFMQMSIFGTIHEAGHALYEQGFLPEWDRTPMAEAISMGYHESQSRLWENLVGRSKPFWTRYFPKLKETFPEQLKDVTLDDFYAAINNVERSLIRVEADELTYNLHILLRYNMELMLFEDKMDAGEAPQVWNDMMNKYLQITPPTNADGVLQDIHWSQGYFGYFPTYTLGNLYSAQIFQQIRKDIDDVDGKIASGEFAPIKKWLNENIHQHGKRYTADELTQKITGEKLNSDHWLRYAKEKFGPIYGVEL